MDREFWLQRWQREEIGFHQADHNPHLLKHWPELELPAATQVFVPLCGKSRDMLWLAGQGHQVLGVELSKLAVEQFFQEHDLRPRRSHSGPFEQWQAGDITILVGDFFDLDSSRLAATRGVFDRASLIALPPDLRQRYARHLADTAPADVSILLVTMEYPQQEMNGPPFAVGEDEVHRLYDPYYNVQRVADHDIWAQTPRFQDKGLTELHEKIYRLNRS